MRKGQMLHLIRYGITKSCTLGVIMYEGKEICYSLERPFVFYDDGRSKNNEGAIENGVYPLKLRTCGGYAKKFKKRWGHQGSLQVITDESGNAAHRGSILIHPGNNISHTRGCILPVSALQIGVNGTTGSSSRKAYLKVWELFRSFSEGSITISEDGKQVRGVSDEEKDESEENIDRGDL